MIRLTQCALFDVTLIGCYRMWGDNVCGDLCKRGFPVKTNQNMCHRVQTVRNLVRGRGKLYRDSVRGNYFFTIYCA